MGKADLLPCAIRWWHGFRPLEWTEKEHLKNPDINVNGFAARELALCVAQCVRKRKRGKGK